jgi:hypothetical protein
MATPILWKNGLMITKVSSTPAIYNLQFTLHNDHFYLAKILNIDILTLIYDLNRDIYEKVINVKNGENEADTIILFRHFFEDVGFPQRYSHTNVIKTIEYDEDGIQEKVIRFLSTGVDTSVPKPSCVPASAEKTDMTRMETECILTSPHRAECTIHVTFGNQMTIPPFLEKMIGVIIYKIFSRVKKFIENVSV